VDKIKYTELVSFLEQRSVKNILSFSDQQQAAARFNCSLRDVEEVSLKCSILPKRFERNDLSCQDQLKLLRARVGVIGCGGLGGRNAELLARIGIGMLLLVDPDRFSESNLNRQNFCTIETIDCHKVEVVAGELQRINPVLETKTDACHFNADSIDTVDIVVDALDSTAARKQLSRLCRDRSIPLIHGAVKGWYGQAGVEQSLSPLIDLLYSNNQSASSGMNKTLSMTVALVAAIQVSETCKLLLGHDSSLTGGWLQCDLLHNDFDMIHH